MRKVPYNALIIEMPPFVTKVEAVYRNNNGSSVGMPDSLQLTFTCGHSYLMRNGIELSGCPRGCHSTKPPGR